MPAVRRGAFATAGDAEWGWPARLALAGPWAVRTQFLHQTDLTAKEYVKRKAWKSATAPECPYHPHGGCELVAHGSYGRVSPQGLRVQRFLCPETGRTVSLLPVFMAARLTGTLLQAEAAAAAVEQAGDQPPKWRKLHPARYFCGQARRWVMRRVRGVRALLGTLVTLYPERCGAAEPTLTGFAELEGVAPGDGLLLERLRRLAEQQLDVLPAPVGFLRGPPNSVPQAGPETVQHSMARSPPPATGAGLAD